MLREDLERNQRLNVDYILRMIPNGNVDRKLAIDTWNDYANAYRAFSEKNSDATMVDMIGHYARFSRVLHELDDKYGKRD